MISRQINRGLIPDSEALEVPLAWLEDVLYAEHQSRGGALWGHWLKKTCDSFSFGGCEDWRMAGARSQAGFHRY
jgi:hypothetical protein